MKVTLGARIKAHRKAKGWTQTTLMDAVLLLMKRDGIDDPKFCQQTISKQENSGSTSSLYLTYYAEAFAVHPRHLLCDEETDLCDPENKPKLYLGPYQNLINAAQNGWIDTHDKEILNCLEKKYRQLD